MSVLDQRYLNNPSKSLENLKIHTKDINSIIEMAWADEISFDHIYLQYGVKESRVIKLMRQNLKASSFKLWRKRVTSRKSKHLKLKALLD